MLNGIESLPLGNAHITDYQWTLQSGDDSVKMEVKPDESQGAGPKTGRGNQWDISWRVTATLIPTNSEKLP